MKRAVALLLVLVAAAALADRFDELSSALTTDGSYKVRAQAAIVLGKLKDKRGVPALVKALGDDEEAVRTVAASSLGKIGDRSALDALRAKMDDPSMAVRSSAGKAIAAIEATKEGPARGSRRVVLDVTPVPLPKDRPEMAKYVQDKIAGSLGKIPDVTLAPEDGAQRFFVDTRIAKLASKKSGDGQVTIDCDVNVIVATHPDHAIKMMATVGGSLDDRDDPSSIKGAMTFCLGDAAKQVAEKVQTYLQGVR